MFKSFYSTMNFSLNLIETKHRLKKYTKSQYQMFESFIFHIEYTLQDSSFPSPLPSNFDKQLTLTMLESILKFTVSTQSSTFKDTITDLKTLIHYTKTNF